MRTVRTSRLAAVAAVVLVGVVGCQKKAPKDVKMPQVDLSGKQVLMVIASKDFQDKEYQEPATALKNAKATVAVAASTKEKCVGVLKKQTVTPDLLLSDVDVGKYDAVIFVGGPGAKEYFDDPIAHRIAKDAVSKGKLLAAICIAPSILANAGVLKDKKATVWSAKGSTAEEKNLRDKGAKYEKKPVVVEGKIITADGPESARQFAKAILGALAKK